ncbi:GDP-mannose-dependent alpha-(1-6)-phosphatidylinositol monomannoside mannosyltransferase [Vibrio cholerae]|nr:N-acetyl-alpha-D-glucosaminyl L-malate synthase [Vibrio cholerae]GHX42267.1 GDP-mannose-dependent alpha-(1-6)-phosphatidylinositol monomannoside mannosyltransferase [Vibrio cholerae]
MKILVFSHEFPPDVGGAGVVAEQNARALSLLGHDVTVLTRYKCNNTAKDHTYRLKEVHALNKLWFLSYKKAVDFSSYDLILLNDPAAIYVAGLFFNKKTLDKSYAFLHGSEPELIYIKPSFSYKISFFCHYYTKALNNIKKIVAVSDFMKNKFLDKTELNHLEAKILVNYSGVNLDVFKPDKRRDLKKELNIPETSQLLISVSRIVKMKGYPVMLDIFERIIKKDRNYYWLIVGDGEYLNELKKKVETKGLQKHIFFLGSKPRAELSYYYSNADVFWLLSEYEESFGLCYLEAQACGIPAIGSNHSGIKEAISTNTGFLIDDADYCLEVILLKHYHLIDRKDILAFSSRFSLEELILFLEV